MPKIDLHTHSIASPDGGLSAADYRQMLASHQLDMVAITDHTTIDFGQKLQRQLGESIIVGQEVKSSAGEIIGLYLTETIPARLTPTETVARIKAQGGLVYIPHPFETVRSGIQPSELEKIIDEVAIIEIGNGRAVFQNKAMLAKEWAKKHQLVGAASSDAHGLAGWGRTFSEVAELPTKETLVRLLASAKTTVGWPGVRALAYPKLNRLKKRGVA